MNLPRFVGVQKDGYSARRLGGLTNLVYRVEIGDEKLIVRIPGAGTEEYIDRAVELHNALVAADAGVSAKVLWADGATGVMICECLDPVTTMTPKLFTSTKGAPERAGSALAQLHNCGQEFKFRFELFAMIDEYLGILAGKETELPEGYEGIVKAAQPVKQTLAANPATLAPCHNDPLCENFLDDGDRMWIVDWEYSGMNDPLWDLGDRSVEGGFTDTDDMEMLRAYFGRDPLAHEIGRMVIYKAMCDLLWTLWGLIQHADDNPAEDFWAYSVERFERCKTLMNSPAFSAHLAAI
ncbi:MAG: phosphotransferase family protein [Rhodobacteraceae bacterium]|nr:phosphotransferase family protein [Paracoccaceae bacterium]